MRRNVLSEDRMRGDHMDSIIVPAREECWLLPASLQDRSQELLFPSCKMRTVVAQVSVPHVCAGTLPPKDPTIRAGSDQELISFTHADTNPGKRGARLGLRGPPPGPVGPVSAWLAPLIPFCPAEP